MFCATELLQGKNCIENRDWDEGLAAVGHNICVCTLDKYLEG